MILTDKAKQDFLLHCGQPEATVTAHIDVYMFAIIEWLDIIGIFISIEGDFDTMLGYHRGFEVHVYQDGKPPVSLLEDNDVFETRQSATEAAIKLANEIYNKRV